MDECRFCRGNEDDYPSLIEDTIDFGRLGEQMISIVIEEDKLYCQLEPGDGSVLFYKELKINYCPMCGRKLN